MNELIRFTRPIDLWIKAHSKTNASYLRKRSIMLHYYSLANATQICFIAKHNQVSRQYVNSVVNQIENFNYSNALSYLSKLKAIYTRRLDELCQQTPVTIDLVLKDFKDRCLIPKKLRLQQFKSLLRRLDIEHQILNLWQQSFIINTSCRVHKEGLLLQLKQIKRELEYHLKRKLILSMPQLSLLLDGERLLLELIIKQCQEFICFKSYVIYNWSKQKRKTEFAYLIAKVFALYQRLSAESLLKIIRGNSRLVLDHFHLITLSDDLILAALISAGLVEQKGEYFYAEGKAEFLMPSERGIIAVLNKTKRLQAGHIMSLAQRRRWDKAGNNRLTRSPLLNHCADGWYQLFPYPQHSLETIKT